MTGLSTSPVCSFFIGMREGSIQRTLADTPEESVLRNGTYVNTTPGENYIPLRQTLFTDTEFLNEGPVLVDILFFQIVEKAPSLTNKLQQALS